MTTSVVRPSLRELRELISTTAFQPQDRTPFSLLPEGLPKGGLIEISGRAATEVLARFLSEHPKLKTLWLEETFTLNPYALAQRGVNLTKLLFVEAGREIRWCTTQAVQSGCFQVLITNESNLDEKNLRRYQLLSEKSDLHFFILSNKPSSSWVFKLQLLVTSDSSTPSLRIFKQRGCA